MTFNFSPVLAQTGQPLLGNQWLALFVILGSVTAFLLAIAAIGRWLAATHPDEPAKPVVSTESAPTPAPTTPLATSTNSETPAEIFATIAAAVAVTLGAKARVTAINLVPAQSAPESPLQWSLEGRRQIYSSHKVR
jgi:membrane glycosyltransferase